MIWDEGSADPPQAGKKAGWGITERIGGFVVPWSKEQGG